MLLKGHKVLLRWIPFYVDQATKDAAAEIAD
jgi:hypothetical protein